MSSAGSLSLQCKRGVQVRERLIYAVQVKLDSIDYCYWPASAVHKYPLSAKKSPTLRPSYTRDYPNFLKVEKQFRRFYPRATCATAVLPTLADLSLQVHKVRDSQS
jgi:hypothetical protein